MLRGARLGCSQGRRRRSESYRPSHPGCSNFPLIGIVERKPIVRGQAETTLKSEAHFALLRWRISGVGVPHTNPAGASLNATPKVLPLSLSLRAFVQLSMLFSILAQDLLVLHRCCHQPTDLYAIIVLLSPRFRPPCVTGRLTDTARRPRHWATRPFGIARGAVCQCGNRARAETIFSYSPRL